MTVFFIDNRNGKFWDKYFQPMPNKILFPPNDTIELRLAKLKKKFRNIALEKPI